MRVLIADDQPTVRYALRILLGNQVGVEIVGEAENAGELILQTRKTYPDLVLLDWELPGLAEAGSLVRLRQVSQGLIVIALSGRSESRRAAMAVGVNAFVSKVEPPERLLAAMFKYRYHIHDPARRLLHSEV